MQTLFRDLLVTLRRLRKAPGSTFTAILTLAFGIGATTAIFSIVEGVLLRPLPFSQPDRLVTLTDHLEGAGNDVAGATSTCARHEVSPVLAVIGKRAMNSPELESLRRSMLRGLLRVSFRCSAYRH
jgi:hypothetical protein